MINEELQEKTKKQSKELNSIQKELTQKDLMVVELKSVIEKVKNRENSYIAGMNHCTKKQFGNILNVKVNESKLKTIPRSMNSSMSKQ